MTCIVGIEVDGKVLIGGDIQGTGGNHKIVHSQPKVFLKRNVLFGYTTSYRFGQILENLLHDPVVPEDDNEVYRWIVTVLIPDIKKTLKDNDYTMGGTCLIGIRGQLWGMQDDFSVLRSVNGYDSCGSGQEYALGCIAHTVKYTALNEQTAKGILRDAIKIASQFSPSVGADSVVKST